VGLFCLGGGGAPPPPPTAQPSAIAAGAAFTQCASHQLSGAKTP
jgi:hypothetical protein